MGAGGTHWSQRFCCENPLIGFWPIAGQLKLEEVRSPALWWCSYVFHAMWQTQSTIHNLGRISEEVGINLLNCPLTHSWVASNLAIRWDPDKLEPEAKLSTCGVLDDFGVFFSRKSWPFWNGKLEPNTLENPAGLKGMARKWNMDEPTKLVIFATDHPVFRTIILNCDQM